MSPESSHHKVGVRNDLNIPYWFEVCLRHVMSYTSKEQAEEVVGSQEYVRIAD